MEDPTHDDPLGLALSILSAEDRAHFDEIASALVEAADAAAGTPGFEVRDPAAAYRQLAAYYRARGDVVWCALSAASARITALDNAD
ncbi:hypothetical protein [Streptomyces sp. NPDC059063]|uniref:hypothetical protein n=1 Tax=unclassified Streptomyces TaxID=2593676 RepID=UPI00369620EC